MGEVVELVVHPDVYLDPDQLRALAIRRARGRGRDIVGHRVLRKAIDARKGRVRLNLKVELLRANESEPKPATFELPTLSALPEVAIVGAGPAGLFCAWRLAQRGIRSVVFERGKPVRARRRDLAALTRHGQLNPESNYCFGEGGAGTFSDGKLYTRSDKRGEAREVLDVFVAHGADPQILVDARPHIGTNRLPGVIGRLREHLESAGSRVEFERRVDGLVVEHGRVVGLRLASAAVVEVRAVVVTPGHSAHDVLRWCAAAGAQVEFKPFAMGVRIEHPQSFIDAVQFGSLAGHPALGAASYRLVEQVEGHGVFSFCMCPGGFIAPAATDAGAQVVNGWSPSSRSGRWANSGLVTEVGALQLAELGGDPTDPFAGLKVQRALEQRAYEAAGGGYVGPAQTLRDFVDGRVQSGLPPCSYPRGLRSAPLHEVLGPLGQPIRRALSSIESRMPGFVSEHAVAVGVESRTSCPVRLPRDASLQSTTLPGLYPGGEGAGYAGGIMSAALDGMRIAEAIASTKKGPSRPGQSPDG